MTVVEQPFTLRRLAGEPIVTMIIQPGYDFTRDLPVSTQAAMDLLNTLDEPVFYVLDLRTLYVEMELVMQWTAIAAKDPGALYRHPMLREALFVFDRITDIAESIAAGLHSEEFGYIKARVFPDVEAALAYARSQN